MKLNLSNHTINHVLQNDGITFANTNNFNINLGFNFNDILEYKELLTANNSLGTKL